MFVYFLLVVGVAWRHIVLVQAFEKLEFWTRNYELDGLFARRVFNVTNEHSQTQSFEKKIRVNTRNATLSKNSTKSVLRINLITPADLERSFSNQNKHAKRIGKSDVLKQGHWPKMQSKGHASTKIMTPRYLMQNEDNEEPYEEKKEKVHHENDLPLNFYNLKQQMEELVNDFPKVNMTIEVIGRTAEYKDIVLIKATESLGARTYFRADDSRYVDEVPEKKIIFIVHGLSPLGVGLLPCLSSMRQFKILLGYYFEHLDKFDIFVIPLANPDGAAEQKSRFVYGEGRHWYMWNKNMSPQDMCLGVSLDRNFDVAWNESHTQIGSCSQLYPGKTPFSEPETKAIRDIFHYYGHKITAYLNVQSSSYSSSAIKGDAVLYPKGYSDMQTDDDIYIDLRADIEEAMKNGSFQFVSVTVDTLYSWYGKIFGSSVDYASTVYGIPHSLELLMQPVDIFHTSSSEDYIFYSRYALSGIWKRILNVIFNNVYKNMKINDNV